MTLAFSRAGILPSWGWEEGKIAACRISPVGLTHVGLIFQCTGSSFVRHWWNVFEIYGYTPATKDGMSSLVCLKAWNESMGCLFTDYLTVASSSAVNFMELGEEGLGSIWYH